MHGVNEVNSAILRELQDTSWNTTVSEHSPLERDVTSHDASSNTTSRDVMPSSRYITPISSNPNLVRRKYSHSDLLSRKPGLPSHSSTPSIPEPSKRRLCKRRKSSQKICRKHPSTLFFVSSSDSDNESDSSKENKIICRRYESFSSFDLSNNSIKPENQSCKSAKVEKTIKIVNSRLDKSACFREKSVREGLRNGHSIVKSRSIGKLFFDTDEKEIVDEDLWDPTPSLSSLSRLVKSANNKTPTDIAESPAPLAKSLVSAESCFKNFKHLETSLRSNRAGRPTKLFFCDPSYINSGSSEHEASSKWLHSALSSYNKEVKLEVKLEECVEPSVKIEKVEKIEHLPGSLIGLDPQFWLPVKVRISTLSTLKPSSAVSGLWEISNHPIQKVQIIGLVTEVDAKEKFTKYKVEDTSGGVHCVHWHTQTDSSTAPTRYLLGDLVCVTAKVAQFRDKIELKIVEIFDLDDMNQLTLHLALSDEAMKRLEKPFILPDVSAQCTEFEQKIRDAVMENILQKGPCSNPRQYNEIQNVKIWLQCLTALTGRDEDEILHEIHQEFSNLNDKSSKLQKDRKKAHELVTKSLTSCQQIDTKQLKKSYPGFSDHIDAVVSQLLMSGDIYESETGVYNSV